jgi:metal-responsive CopG/Arc/MetJ family transcriptional regulator
VKTAISLPDDLHKKADAAARRLGVSRSRLYAMAVAEYVAKYEIDEVTERLNRVYAEDPGEPDPVLFALAMEAIEDEAW